MYYKDEDINPELTVFQMRKNEGIAQFSSKLYIDYLRFLKEHSNARIWDELYKKDMENLPWLTNPYPEILFNSFSQLFKESEKVLDYGCGNGRYCKLLSQFGASVTNVDISRRAIKLCKKENPNSICLTSYTPEIFNNEDFHGIFCWGVLHHIPPLLRPSFLESFANSIKVGGFILLGGWSRLDSEHEVSLRISSITNNPTWDIDNNIQRIALKLGLSIIHFESFPFIESITNKKRMFSCYLLEKM